MNRHQDTQITRTGASDEDSWITDGWFNRFSQDPDSPDPGDRLGLRALPIPSLDVLLGYSEAVHKRTMAFVSGLDSNQLDHPLTDGIENYSVGNCLRHLITHQNNHHGQIDYIRGLQYEIEILQQKLASDLIHLLSLVLLFWLDLRLKASLY